MEAHGIGKKEIKRKRYLDEHYENTQTLSTSVRHLR